MSRKTARKHAFNLIYQIPFHIDGGMARLAELKAHYYDFVSEDLSDLEGMQGLKRPSGPDAKYIDKTVWGVYEKQSELDGIIEQFLSDWTINRISLIDLALLRMSIYEMLIHEDVPLGVAVNEAVILAKQYSSDESPAFINGVLGGVLRSIQSKGREGVVK